MAFCVSTAFGEMNLAINATPSTVYQKLMDPAQCKHWMMGGGAFGVEDVTRVAPDTGAKNAFMGKVKEMTSTTQCLYEVTESKLNEFIRMECKMVYYADETSTKEVMVNNPTLKFRSDFYFFEAKNGGTEIIRQIEDFEHSKTFFFACYLNTWDI